MDYAELLLRLVRQSHHLTRRMRRIRVVSVVLVVLVALFAVGWHWRGTHKDPTYEYVVPGAIAPIRQPDSMDCWAAVTTMLLNWQDNQPMTIADRMASLGDPWNLYFEHNLGLSVKDAPAFFQRARLRAEGSGNPSVAGWYALLRNNGPLWITIAGLSDDNAHVWAHAKVLIGIHGDGTVDGTTFDMIDPAEGTLEELTARAFGEQFENWANVSNPRGWPLLGIEVVHL